MTFRPSYDELRKQYGVGDIVYWGRRVLGFEENDPMTCPNCEPINKRIAELTAQRDRLREVLTIICEGNEYARNMIELLDVLQPGDMTGE